MSKSTLGINRRHFLQSSALGALAVSTPLPLLARNNSPVVETSAGKLRGSQANGVAVFKGIRYGEPPTGAGRFKAPRAAASWSGVKDALAFGHAAPQGRSMDPEGPSPMGFSLQGENATFSEDCLYLNVWTPSLDNSKRPVMVWLHGGGFSTGAGASILYDGSNLARGEDVVVVTLNHRLNGFGHLDLSELGGDEYADSSVVGMLDIVLALQWVRDNIANFGGDPGRVTIFGESGGGRKVSTLMAMPAAQGLFHRAIVQSGSQLLLETPEVGSHRAKLFMQALQLKPGDVRKLRDIPAEKLLQAINRASAAMGQFRPIAGSPALPGHPFHPTAPALSAQVPMLIGTTLTEMSFFLSRNPRLKNLSDDGAVEQIKTLVPADKAASVYATYKRVYPQLNPEDILYRVATDRSYFLDSTIQGALKAQQGAAPAFMYSFEWAQPLGEGRTHVPHGSEIAFAFNNTHLVRGDNNPQALANTMSAAWAAFARSGNPSTEALGEWKPYDEKQRRTMILDAQCRMENDPRGELRELMLSFGSQQLAVPALASLE